MAALTNERARLIRAFHGTSPRLAVPKMAKAGAAVRRPTAVLYGSGRAFVNRGAAPRVEPGRLDPFTDICSRFSTGLQSFAMAQEEVRVSRAQTRTAAQALAGAAQWAVTAVRGLSGQLLFLTIVFVMVAEVAIYLPSVSGERLAYLNRRVQDADLATLALQGAPNDLDTDLNDQILQQIGVRSIVVRGPQTTRLVMPVNYNPDTLDGTYDLRTAGVLDSIPAALAVLRNGQGRVVRAIGMSREQPGSLVEVVMDEGPMAQYLYGYSSRIVSSSVMLSVFTAMLVYFTLLARLVGPMRRVTNSMVAFRHDPDDPTAVVVPSGRKDEIGIAERELAAMQTDLRGALRQNQRLAELGTAVSKISHDLRNILATALLMSDRIALIDDPEVRRLSPSLVKSIDRAIALANDTLRYGRSTEAPIRKVPFNLRELVDEVAISAGVTPEGGLHWRNDIPESFSMRADRDQVFRALLNLGRNSVQAIDQADGGAGTVRFSATRRGGVVTIEVTDSGPGLPNAARESLYKPFAASAKADGTGLGLSIVRDVVRAHRGDITLVRSDPRGTHFRIEFPDA